jgi:hypothetical protein
MYTMYYICVILKILSLLVMDGYGYDISPPER